MATTSGNNAISSSDVPVNEVEAQKESQTQDQTHKESVDKPETEKKKRKGTELRSRVWEHFEQVKDDKGNVVKAKCLYCAKIFCCEPKRHGTSSLRNHMLSCLKNPHSKDSRQSLLTFKPDNASSDSVGVMGTWKFD